MQADVAKVAVIAGFDTYGDGVAKPSLGCAADAKRLKTYLQQGWSPSEPDSFDCDLLTTEADRPAIGAAELRCSIAKALAANAEVLWFHFSGRARIENSELLLVAGDGRTVALRRLLHLFDLSPGGQRVVTIDCELADPSELQAAVDPNSLDMPESCALFVADRSSRTGFDGTSCPGWLTGIVSDALAGEAADLLGQVTMSGLYAYVESFSRFVAPPPVLVANLAQATVLRNCEPRIASLTLECLPGWFARPTDTFPLDRSFEPSERSFAPDRGQTYAALHDCLRVGLIEPVDADDLYHAAINSTGCRLTALGRRYWNVVKAGTMGLLPV